MTDVLLQLGESALARRIVGSAKLPIPMPQKLVRVDGAVPERFLEGKRVFVGGEGDLSAVIARVVAHAGASASVTSDTLASAFAPSGEAFGRPLGRITTAPGGGEAGERAHALVFDATCVDSPLALKGLYTFFHGQLGALAQNGRIVVLGRPPEAASGYEQASARAALEGFTRALAKEIGGKGATANLIYVADGAEARAASPLRFFLSAASAFVSTQPLRVTSEVRWDGADPSERPLSGKVALVTGGARGIGEAAVRVLAAEGARVVVLDRPEDDEQASRVAREVGGTVILCDVSDPGAPARIAADLLRTHGGVDIVVHNAGITRDKTLARMKESLWDQTLGINLEAVVRITEKLLQGCLRNGGRIVSLSSVSGIAGNMGQTNYSASKAGVMGFTRFLSKELAPRSITVNALAPGFIETRMTASMPVFVREAGRRLSALGQGGQPEDVARAIAFLAMDGSAGVTGQVLRVCGGALIGA
jgi:3-oxoacyl-[acyl-carrier protein] reductase